MAAHDRSRTSESSVLSATSTRTWSCGIPKLRMEEGGSQGDSGRAGSGVKYEGKNGYPCVSDAAIADMKADRLCRSALSGRLHAGQALRRDPKVLDLIRTFDQQKKLIAAIRHGGWMPISAKVYRGVRVTGSPGIKDDLENAGAIWRTSRSSSTATSSPAASRMISRILPSGCCRS